MKLFSIILLFGAVISAVENAKILMIAPMPAHSHFTLTSSLAKALANKGHQVACINPYPQKEKIPNYRDISVESLVDYIEEFKKHLFKLESQTILGKMFGFYNMTVSITRETLEHKNVQTLLKSEEQFDVVIMATFVNDALLGIGHHFKAPIILLSPIGPNVMNNHLFANPAPSSYVPNAVHVFSKQMNFWQRIQNFLINQIMDLVRTIIVQPQHEALFKKHFDTDVELTEIMYNVSLMLTNSHISVNDPAPLVPAIIEIGGFHVNPPKKLPEDLQTFLDDAKDGVILFSMGSNLKSKDLTLTVREAILKSFSKIKQKVLWKFEADLPEAPKNVKIMKWLPQQDILAHGNVRAFISHGGLLSTIETVSRGVPVVGIPVFGDQKTNIAAAVNNGYAVSVPLQELNEETLTWALNEVLNNPKYRENVQRRSKLMADRPLKPIDTAVYWVEHVIRHKGAPHLRSAGLDLKWYQRDMVDIVVFLVLVTSISIALCYITIKKILGLCFSSKSKVSKEKKTR